MAKLSITLCDASDNELEMIFSPDYHYEHDKSNPLLLIELLHSKDQKFNNVYDLKEEDIRDLIHYLQSVLSNFQQIDFSRYQPK